MIDELTTTAKQTALELISMSSVLAEDMETWGDILARNPESVTATISAGFINKPSVISGIDLVIDIQAPPDKDAVLRTWAIETKIGDDQKEYFNNIQLTFAADGQQARGLIAKGKTITREDIRLLLQSPASRLARITVTSESGGGEAKQSYDERYDLTTVELSQRQDDIAKVDRALRVVLQTLKQSVVNSLR